MRILSVIVILLVCLLSSCEMMKELQHGISKTTDKPAEQQPAAAKPRSASAPAKLSATDRMMRVALAMRGKPYRYQGENPDGFDASGLVYYCHKQVGLDLPRSFQQQLSESRPVNKDQIRPGDLLFFRLGTNKATHVGIYLGVHKFVHAPPNHNKVILSDLHSTYWKKALVRGGRYRFK